jgi:DNA-binding transcriptional MerR regulator
MSSASSPADASLSIGQLASRADAPISTIRYWERAGLLDPPPRESGRRRYDESALDRIGLIRICQDAGFGIGETRALLTDGPGEISTWKQRAPEKLAELRTRIAEAERAAQVLEHAMACKAPSLLECPTFRAGVRARAEGTPIDALHGWNA